MTVFQLTRKLEELYRPYFKSASAIEVRIKEKRSWLDVRGLVAKPGRFLVEPEASLDLVIGLAGGLSKDPAPIYVRIQKGPKFLVIDLNQYYTFSQDIYQPQILGWLGGEILFFQKEFSTPMGGDTLFSEYRSSVYMMGEVRRPGEYTLTSGSDIVDTLVQAGGFTERADLDYIEIVRQGEGKKHTYAFSWNKLQHAPIPQQGDIVLVHADRTSRGERKTLLWATIISALATVATTAVLFLTYDENRRERDRQ